MKLNLKYWSMAIVLCFTLFGFLGATKIQAAEVKTEAQNIGLDAKKEELASQIKIYDENGDEIHPYTLQELKDMITLDDQNQDNPIHALYKTYTSKPFGFKYNFSIGGGTYGKAFKNPITLLITPQGTAKKFSVAAKYDNGKGGVGGTAGKISLPGGWTGQIHMNWGRVLKMRIYNGNVIFTHK